MLDLVLVNPGSRTRIYQSLGARLTAVENPVWAGLIASFVRRRGYSVEIVDAEADDLSRRNRRRRGLQSSRPGSRRSSSTAISPPRPRRT